MINLPQEYVVEQVYRYGYQVKYNKITDTYQFGCPVCREGKSLGKKRRCFYIPKNNNIFCHNCGWSSTPLKWIKKNSGETDDIILENIKNFESSTTLESLLKGIEEPVEIKTVPSLPTDCINLFDPQQIEYYKNNKIVKLAIETLKSRRIATAINRPKNLYVSLEDKVHKNRLIIPFVNEKKDIEFYQSRTLLVEDNNTKPKYLSKLYGEKTLFGVDQIDTNIQDIFIFEGPINAMFVRNGVAVGGIQKSGQQFTSRQQEQIGQFKWFNKIWVLDSQWIDHTSLIKTELLLQQGEQVFIWPENIGKHFKDFNDLTKKYSLDEISGNFIKKNTCEGITGIVKLTNIKKYWD